MDFLLTPPKRAEKSASGSSFRQPPMDGSVTIPEIFDWHYENNPDHAVFVHANGAGNHRYHTYSEVVPAAHHAGRYIAKAARIDLAVGRETYPVVAILATADTITYFTTVVGMLRAGITPFPISPRFSPAVVAHLLAKTQAAYLFVSVEPEVQTLARKAIDELEASAEHPPRLAKMPVYEDLYLGSSFERLPARKYDLSSTAMIVHSSSSTSLFPKAVPWSFRSNLQTAIVPLFSSHNLCGQIFGCHGIELFHTLGLFFIFWLSTSGLVMATFPPASPATPPTADAVFQGFRDIRPSYALASPRFIEEWALDASKVRFLSSLKAIGYGGKFLSKMIGDMLAKSGVQLCTFYGSTETGNISAVMTAPQGPDWEYFTLNPHCSAEFIPNGDGTYHIVIVSNKTQMLPLTDTTFEGRAAYNTNDIAVPHPRKPGHWKLLGRLDDQIMLSTGEVTNPIALEDIIREHPQVAGVLMFGRARPMHGILLELKREYAFNPADKTKLAAFRNTIWPQVEKMNAHALPHSRVTKEMIIVTTPSKPFVYTQKGSPKRPIIHQQYQPEIDALYGSPVPVPDVDPLQTKRALVAPPAKEYVDSEKVALSNTIYDVARSWLFGFWKKEVYI